MALFYNITTTSEDPNGIKIMSNPTKTLKGIMFPREELQNFYNMDEANQTGIYILYNTADKNEKPQIYIGQTGYNITSRLRDHNRNRDFWNYALVFVEKGDFLNMNSAHTKLIESSLIHRAKLSNVAVMDNSTGSNAPRIQLADEYAAQTWAEEVIAMTQLLGLSFFNINKSNVKTDSDEKLTDVFYIKKKGFCAKGSLLSSSGDFIVYKGSTICMVPTNSCPDYMRDKRKQMSKFLSGNKLKEDIKFSSPSSAAGFVCFAAANGWIEWKTEDDKLLKEYKNNN